MASKTDIRQNNVKSTLPLGKVHARSVEDVPATRIHAEGNVTPSAKGLLDLTGADDHGRTLKSVHAPLHALHAPPRS